MLELYACMTPNVLKVMFALGELDLAFQLRRVRIYRGENFAEGFEGLHPYRKLPVLIDHEGPAGGSGGGPHRVFESGAILVYLAEKTGKLFGRDAAERSAVMQWLMLQMSSTGPLVGQATHFNRAAPPDQPYALRRFVTQAVRLCELYDARLGEARFLAGDAFSIADLATFPWLWRHPWNLGLDPAAYPKLMRWIDELRVRPGLTRVHGRYKELVRLDREDAATAPPQVIDRLLGRDHWT